MVLNTNFNQGHIRWNKTIYRATCCICITAIGVWQCAQSQNQQASEWIIMFFNSVFFSSIGTRRVIKIQNLTKTYPEHNENKDEENYKKKHYFVFFRFLYAQEKSNYERGSSSLILHYVGPSLFCIKTILKTFTSTKRAVFFYFCLLAHHFVEHNWHLYLIVAMSPNKKQSTKSKKSNFEIIDKIVGKLCKWS